MMSSSNCSLDPSKMVIFLVMITSAGIAMIHGRWGVDGGLAADSLDDELLLSSTSIDSLPATAASSPPVHEIYQEILLHNCI